MIQPGGSPEQHTCLPGRLALRDPKGAGGTNGKPLWEMSKRQACIALTAAAMGFDHPYPYDVIFVTQRVVFVGCCESK
jgi:hypothetical protein